MRCRPHYFREAAWMGSAVHCFCHSRRVRNQSMPPKDPPAKSVSIGAIAGAILVIAVVAAFVWHCSAGAHGQEANPPSAATYVGQEKCAQCHAEQVAA